VENILLRKFFYVPAFEIYGGVGGLYDWGPPGCAIKQNLLTLWRQHFVLEENMLEVDCTCVTPDIVLRTSGHVAKFADYMVKDSKTGACHRADHLLEGHIDHLLEDNKKTKKIAQNEVSELLALRSKAGALQQEDLAASLKKLNVKAPETGNDISDPFPFNLMFGTEIGPSGKVPGFLRPETAQGIFVNFRRLLEYNAGRMPFACAQIGLAFRNEIAPRSGLLRVREFQMAEIEHFVDGDDKSHSKFSTVANNKLWLLGRADQTGADIPRSLTVGEAVKKNIINNETLAYFMARTALFLHSVGIKPDLLRFRQHKSTEMAHYAQDCWDAEVKTTYGWIECVGHADRSAYDLKVHTDSSKIELLAYEAFDTPKLVKKLTVKPNKAKLGQKYKAEAKFLLDYLSEIEQSEQKALKLQTDLAKGPVTIKEKNGKEFQIDSSLVEIKNEEKKENGRKYLPHVIEPSFGIGRIIYSLLEQSYYLRPEEDQPDDKETQGVLRAVLQLPPTIAPIKVAILPLSTDKTLLPSAQELVKSFVALNLTPRLDDSSVNIGKKYARADELGIPYDVTIDFQSLEDKTVTVRERDSTQQIRVSLHDVPFIVAQLITQTITWDYAYNKYPRQAQKNA